MVFYLGDLKSGCNMKLSIMKPSINQVCIQGGFGDFKWLVYFQCLYLEKGVARGRRIHVKNMSVNN